MSEGRLGPEVFKALAAVAWADGTIQPAEAAAIERAAAQEGLAGADLDAVKAALQTRVGLKDVNVASLSEADKMYVYGISSWVASVQDGVGLRERIALNEVGKVLSLTQRSRDAMDKAVKELLGKPG